jgi:hypothetical protein
MLNPFFAAPGTAPRSDPITNHIIKMVLGAPRSNTPQMLLNECESLRHRLADSPQAIPVIAAGRDIVHRLWETMRLMGGEVPPWPALPECGEIKAFVDLVTNGERRAAMNLALDAAVAWCIRRGASGARRDGGAELSRSVPPAVGAERSEGEKPAIVAADPAPAADPFADLRTFACDKLIGKQQAVIQALIDAGGKMPIANLAVSKRIEWNDAAEGFGNMKKRLTPKLKKLHWELFRQGNAAIIRQIRGSK